MQLFRSSPQGELSPEFRLAVAATVWPQSAERNQYMEAALVSAIDWDLFLRIVRRHRIDGLAFHALSAATAPWPDETRLKLQAAAQRQANKSLPYAAETIRVCRLLQAGGIQVACLKGATLSMLAFGDLGLRHSRDIDLLISPGDALRADEVLSAAGYALEMPIGPHSLSQKTHWIEHRKHFEYKERSKGIPLELHWRLFDNQSFFAAVTEPSAWVDVPILGTTFLCTLSGPDLLLYLCVHGANHMWFRLKWLADVQALLRQAGIESIQRLQEDARTRGCERAVAQTLALLQLLYGFPSPELVTPVHKAIPALVQSALAAMTAGDAASELETVPFGTSRVAAARYRLKPEWRFWFREAGALLTDEHDRKSARLPHSMRFFLPVLRVPLWLGRRLLGRGQSHRG
jgi:hypothetical protein